MSMPWAIRRKLSRLKPRSGGNDENNGSVDKRLERTPFEQHQG